MKRESERRKSQTSSTASSAQHKLKESSGVDFEILKDVDRTLLDNPRFTERHRESLHCVLKAVADLDPEVGYVQGLNFIIANFLLAFDHKGASWAERTSLSAFTNLVSRLGIRNFYTDKMIGLKEANFKLECLLYNLLPDVYIHLEANGIMTDYFTS